MLYSCSNKLVHRDSRGLKLPSAAKDELPPLKKKIALLNLYNEGDLGGDDLEIAATEELRNELGRTQEFIVDAVDATIFGPSKEIYTGAGIKLQLLSKKARLSGINFVLFGRITMARVREKIDEIGFIRQTKSFAEAKIELKIFDVISNKEVFSETFDGYSTDDNFNFYLSNNEERVERKQELLRYVVQVAVRKSIPKIVDISSKLDWSGRVAKVIGTKIYINAGRMAGIQVGDILKVMTDGNEIYDPESGALIGVTQGEVKGTIEIVDYFGPDGAIAVLHSGGSVNEGDFIRLY